MRQNKSSADDSARVEQVTVIGGAIWGDNSCTDFVASHGVSTPDAFRKVLIRRHRAIAWVIPNTAEATRERQHRHLVSIADLDARTGETIQVDDWLKEESPEVSWMMPVGCNKG